MIKNELQLRLKNIINNASKEELELLLDFINDDFGQYKYHDYIKLPQINIDIDTPTVKPFKPFFTEYFCQ